MGSNQKCRSIPLLCHWVIDLKFWKTSHRWTLVDKTVIWGVGRGHLAQKNLHKPASKNTAPCSRKNTAHQASTPEIEPSIKVVTIEVAIGVLPGEWKMECILYS